MVHRVDPHTKKQNMYYIVTEEWPDPPETFASRFGQLCNEFSEATCIEVNPMISGFNGFEPQYDVAINC